MISSCDTVILRLPARAGEARNLLFAGNFDDLVACRHAV
jgi:hypothetical protein